MVLVKAFSEKTAGIAKKSRLSIQAGLAFKTVLI